ncbi:MAG: hormogonium polysaccharide secretion pseudopilin HpsC [Coleofasciculaceae cyanobacterium]
MKKLLKFLLSPKFKTQKRSKKGGFTLIELLVGLIMAAFIITPLLGFVINVMTSDRQEQAKSSSEQEIQTALDYISRDVSQAIFIYDGFGVQRLVENSALPTPTGVSTPVLVFWKREIKPGILPNDDDAFALSLVAYYLIKDTTCSGTSAWSCTARIGRVQMDSAVTDQAGNILPGGEAKPDGFTTPFDKTTPTASNAPPQTFEQRLNNWTTTDLSGVPVQTLIDYIDQTTLTSASPPTVTDCSTEPSSKRPDLTNPTDAQLADDYPYRQTPNDTGTVPDSLKTGSFYACVDIDKNLAQVFIRGNALARISSKNNPPEYSANKTTYFPRASIQVKASSLINPN